MVAGRELDAIGNLFHKNGAWTLREWERAVAGGF